MSTQYNYLLACGRRFIFSRFREIELAIESSPNASSKDGELPSRGSLQYFVTDFIAVCLPVSIEYRQLS